MKTKHYDSHLTEAKKGINTLLFSEGIIGNKDLFDTINMKYEEVQTAPSAKETQQKMSELKKIVADAYIQKSHANERLSEQQTKALVDQATKDIQGNLAEFLKKKFWEVTFGEYAKITQTSTVKKEPILEFFKFLKKDVFVPGELQEGLDGSFEAVDSYGKIDLSNQSTLINPSKIFSTPKTDKNGQEVKDEHGNTIYVLSSKDPETMIRNMIALNRTSLNFNASGHNTITPNLSKMVENTLREANAHLYGVEAKLNMNGNRPHSLNITGPNVPSELSKEAKRMAYINSALLMHNKITDPFEKTVAAFEELIKGNPQHLVSAKWFIDQQLMIHGNDPAYMENLRKAGAERWHNKPGSELFYHTFFKDMYRKDPDPQEREKNPLQKAIEESFEYNKECMLDDINGQLPKDCNNIDLMLQSLSSDPEKTQITEELTEKLAKIRAQINALQDCHTDHTYESSFRNNMNDSSINSIQMLPDTHELPELQDGVLYFKKTGDNEVTIYSAALEGNERILSSEECNALKNLGNTYVTECLNDSSKGIEIKSDENRELLKDVVSICAKTKRLDDQYSPYNDLKPTDAKPDDYIKDVGNSIDKLKGDIKKLESDIRKELKPAGVTLVISEDHRPDSDEDRNVTLMMPD